MSKKAEWIWNRGDYAIRLLNESLTSRYEREVFVPPFWHMTISAKTSNLSKPSASPARSASAFWRAGNSM